MHIALVNQWYPPETGGGGVATHNYYFANACAQLGHKVTVIANQPAGSAARTRCPTKNLTILRVPSPNFYRYRRIPLIGRQYRFAQAVLYSRIVCQALATVHREDPVDVVEFADVNAEGFFWKKGLGRSSVVRCHTPAWILARYGGRELPYDASLLGWAEKSIIRRVDALTAPSHDMAQAISTDCNIPTQNIHAIANALDTDEFAPPQTSRESKRLTILALGRIDPLKGADVLIEAVPQVCKQIPGVRFVIAGNARKRPDGEGYHDYMRRVLAVELATGQVEIRGFIPDAELPRMYHESDISIVPSLIYESFSFTVAQSMACGLPTVASAIGGIPETVDYGRCGVLVKPGSVQELADALVSLAQDPERRKLLGQAAREHAVSHFSSKVVAEKTLDIYAVL